MDNLSKNKAKRWYWLLVFPWVLALWIPSFNHIEPRLFGFPFFYWYQLLLVFVAAITIGIVYYKAHVQVAKKHASNKNENDSEELEQ
jgi:uncharacterized membrane protein